MAEGWRPSRCYLNGLLHAKNIVKKYLKESEVDTSKEIPTIHDTIYHIGDK